MVGHSYSHLMSQTELFGTGSTYLQFLLEIKMKLVEILIFVGYKIKEQNETKWSSARNFVLNKKVKFLYISKCVELISTTLLRFSQVYKPTLPCPILYFWFEMFFGFHEVFAVFIGHF